jgi:hypothetical protein
VSGYSSPCREPSTSETRCVKRNSERTISASVTLRTMSASVTLRTISASVMLRSARRRRLPLRTRAEGAWPQRRIMHPNECEAWAIGSVARRSAVPSDALGEAVGDAGRGGRVVQHLREPRPGLTREVTPESIHTARVARRAPLVQSMSEMDRATT